MAEVYSGYIAGDVPFVDINNLWGLYPSLEVQLETMDAVADEIAAEVAKQNGTIVSYSYYPPNYLYTSRKINGVADFKGLKTRSHSTVLSDMLSGIGADGQFIAFAEVYSALERGVVEGAIASVDGALIAHWYEVTDYMVGPVVALAQTWITMNKDVFDGMPDDLRALLIEEGVWRGQGKPDAVVQGPPKASPTAQGQGHGGVWLARRRYSVDEGRCGQPHSAGVGGEDRAVPTPTQSGSSTRKWRLSLVSASWPTAAPSSSDHRTESGTAKDLGA